jgi:malonyl-CoA reductase/3-hydroxypropionate dehydrogenase (NADP+)
MALFVLPRKSPTVTMVTPMHCDRRRRCENFVREEVVAPVAFASICAATWIAGLASASLRLLRLRHQPGSDRHGNLLNESYPCVDRGADPWLASRRRDTANAGDLTWAVQPNQMVRYDSEDKDNLTFAADWAATLTNRVRQMDPINLWIPEHQTRNRQSSMPSSI